MLRIAEFMGLQGLEQLADDWSGLFARMPRRGFVHSLGWHRAFAACLSDDPGAMRYWTFHRDGVLRAVVPLQQLPAWGVGPLRVRRLSLPAHRHATLSDALIAPGESPREIMDALRRLLAARGWSRAVAIELPNLLCGHSTLHGIEQPAHGSTASRLMIEKVGSSAWFDTTTRDAVFAGLSSHVRRNLARQRRRLDELGEVRMVRFDGAAAASDGLDAFLELEASGWKAAAGSAIRMHPRIAEFYRMLARELGESPRVVVHLLCVNGRPASGGFCIELDDTLYILKIAYDEQLRAAAPGNCLLENLLDEAARRDELRRVSLVTSPPWAQRWGARNDDLQRVLVLPGGLGGQLLLAAMRARRRLRAERPVSEAGDESLP